MTIRHDLTTPLPPSGHLLPQGEKGIASQHCRNTFAVCRLPFLAYFTQRGWHFSPQPWHPERQEHFHPALLEPVQ